MYSTNIDNNRYFMKCITVVDNIDIIECIVDTGAMYTAFTANMFSCPPDEDTLIKNKNEIKYLGGFVEGHKIKFYRIPLSQFTIGNIDVGHQNIWVTFSDDVTQSVLGIDILKQITFFQIANSGKLCFLDKDEMLSSHLEV